MTRPARGLLVVALVAAGCRSPQERIDESRRNLRSWAATLRLAAEQADEGRLPRAFRRELARSANREVLKEARQLRKLAESGGGAEAGTLAAAAERLAQAAASVSADGHAAAFDRIERDLGGPPP